MTIMKKSPAIAMFALGFILTANCLLLSGCANSGMVNMNAGSGESLMYQKAVAALNEKAQGLMNSGDSQSAVCRLESALDLLPNEVQTMTNLAIAYHDSERYEQAAALYEKLLTLDETKSGYYHKFLAMALESRGDKLMADVSASSNASQAGVARKSALDNYKQSVEHYESAIADGRGLGDKDAESLSNQVKNLKAQMIKIAAGEG